jgi:integrase
MQPDRAISGHVFRVERKRGPAWYAKYRLPDGRQVQKRIGPAWTSRGRPAAGYFTKRTAEDWLRGVIDQARSGTLPGLVRTGVTFAEAAEEYLTWLEVDRERKPSTLRDYRSMVRTHMLPTFGDAFLEDITPDQIERWRLSFDPALANRTKIKVMTVLFGILERARKVHRLPTNPARDMEKPTQRRRAGLDVFSVEEVIALIRAADGEQDATMFLVAAFTGLRRGELVALRWRDVDFSGQTIRVVASYTDGVLTTPKSGKVRSVPMAPEVAAALARLASRGEWTGDDDLVFVGTGGAHLDASALYRRYKLALRRAGLRNLRFHDLRHTFGTRAITKASILQVKEWMGHADVDTTMKYLHYVPRAHEAALLADAFSAEPESSISAGDPDPAAR